MGSSSDCDRSIDARVAAVRRVAPTRFRIPLQHGPAPIDEASVTITVAPSMSDIPMWPVAKGRQPVPQELLGDSDSHHEYLPNVEELPPLPVWNSQGPPSAVATDCGSVHAASSSEVAVGNGARRGAGPKAAAPGAAELRPRTFRQPKGRSSSTTTATVALNRQEQEDQDSGPYRAVPQGSGCAGASSRTSTAATSGGAASSASGRRTASSVSNGEDGGRRPSPARGLRLLPSSPVAAAAEAAAAPQAALSPQAVPQQQWRQPVAARPSRYHADPAGSVAPCGVDGFDVHRLKARASRATAVAPPPLPERLMAGPSSPPAEDGELVQVDRIVYGGSDIRNSSDQKAASAHHSNPSGMNNDKFSELARAFALLDDIT